MSGVKRVIRVWQPVNKLSTQYPMMQLAVSQAAGPKITDEGSSSSSAERLDERRSQQKK